MKVLEELERLRKDSVISLVETEFVRLLAKISPEEEPDIYWAAASCLHAQANGHVCLDIANWNKEYLFDDPKSGRPLTESLKQKWLKILPKSKLVGDGSSLSPLVFEEGRLYTHRFWKYETEFAQWITKRVATKKHLEASVKSSLWKLLKPDGDLFETNWQHVAVGLSFLKDLMIISGGPGTGKTTTVLNIVAAHQMVHEEKEFRVAMAAPTGKAARRLKDSIDQGWQKLPEEIRSELSVPKEATTVHKLLGSDFRGSTFKFNEQNHLPYDLVIIDEASMLDLSMWVRLIRAIGPATQLIVLGDKDQLASVEAGSILGDLCGGDNHFSSNISQELAKLLGVQVPAVQDAPSINDCVVFLTKSYRFARESGIHKFSEAVNAGQADEAIGILNNGKYEDIKWLDLTADSMHDVIRKYAKEHFDTYSTLKVYDRLKASNEMKILCAMRKGDWGVQSVNREAEQMIRRSYQILDNREWYDGRIVMASRNDALLKIRNGEIGLCEGTQEPTIRFEGEEAQSIAPARLSDYEPAYALTIHKSQGSEFNEVAIVLPTSINPILSKEILYTGVTRARSSTLIIAKEEVIRAAILRSVSRSSGLHQKIWKEEI